MNKDKGFLEAIRANPDDRSVKLIYADWLEEANDPRGEFVRVTLALAELPQQDKRYPDLYAQWRELRPLAGAEWLALVDRASAEDDVREAVFRHQLGGPSRGICFLQVEDAKDPSSYLLDRLSDAKCRLKPLSAAQKGGMDGVVDRETGERGILRVDAIRWGDENRCEVEGGYWADGLAADGNVYQVELKDGIWAIVGERMLWIS
jgi:uncharacterized protein (TIGR02996 family)